MPTALLNGLTALAITATTLCAPGNRNATDSRTLRPLSHHGSESPTSGHTVLTEVPRRTAGLARSRPDRRAAADLPREYGLVVRFVSQPACDHVTTSSSTKKAAPSSPRAPPSTFPS